MIDADRDVGDITKWRLSSEELTGEWAGSAGSTSCRPNATYGPAVPSRVDLEQTWFAGDGVLRSGEAVA
jgi:hypothetical protein